MQKKGSILIVGVGNILFSDEGLGVRALEYLEKHYHIPEELTLLDGGTMGLTLVDCLADARKVIIVDAIRGGNPPGFVYSLELKDVPSHIKPLFSLHQLGVNELVGVSKLLHKELDIVLAGMEPMELSPSTELSAVVRLRMPLLAEAIKKEVKKSGVRMRKRRCRG